jgi:hypothetical protein
VKLANFFLGGFSSDKLDDVGYKLITSIDKVRADERFATTSTQIKL